MIVSDATPIIYLGKTGSLSLLKQLYGCIYFSDSVWKELAREYVRRGMIPEKYVFDAYHIASASFGKFEALVTWNFEHILRETTERLLEMINREKNIHIPKLRSPEVYI